MKDSSYWSGVALALFAALCFSTASVSAVIALHAGANPQAIIPVRFAGAILILFVLLRLSGVSLRLTPRERIAAAVLGLFQVVQSFGLVTAYDLIPVGLATILFYLFPLVVGAMTTALGMERLSWPLGLGLAVAFAGLTQVVDVTGEGVGLVGSLAAIGAALSWSIVMITAMRMFGGRDTRPFLFHIQVSSLVLFAAYLAFTGDIALPTGTRGWIGFSIVPFCYAVAITSFFVAGGMIGPVRASLVMYFEGVSAITLGYFVLDQALTPRQLAGAGLVILALLALRWRGERRAA